MRLQDLPVRNCNDCREFFVYKRPNILVNCVGRWEQLHKLANCLNDHSRDQPENDHNANHAGGTGNSQGLSIADEDSAAYNSTKYNKLHISTLISAEAEA
jgi:hypothetical protein